MYKFVAFIQNAFHIRSGSAAFKWEFLKRFTSHYASVAETAENFDKSLVMSASFVMLFMLHCAIYALHEINQQQIVWIVLDCLRVSEIRKVEFKRVSVKKGINFNAIKIPSSWACFSSMEWKMNEEFRQIFYIENLFIFLDQDLYE